MANAYRLGLVEVGSNTIRYIVADFGDNISFVPVRIQTVKHGLHPARPTAEAVAAVNAQVAEFLRDSQGYACRQVVAYGTAACRSVQKALPGALDPRIRVLTPAEEAKAAWVAGFACTEQLPGTRCTVIDEGSGSTEIVSGLWTGSAIDDLAVYSEEIGSVMLVEAYNIQRKGHMAHVTTILQKMVPHLTASGIAEAAPGGQVFLVGGVATSIGWLATKRTGMQEYNPAEINGARVTLAELDQFYRGLADLHRRDPSAARRMVDTRRGSDDHVLKVLSSLPYLILLANFLQPSGTFFVSGYGVRHGMAYLIKNGLIEL